ncbi:MAG: cell division protein FtsZ, partial [Oligoflexia bacterium]|nr:cell division protein FtsZ [Oligoflexia bacterium]
MFYIDDDFNNNARVKVIGIGGGGGNALNTMISARLEGVEFIAANTDKQALESNMAPVKVQLGKRSTKGLGAGGNPDVGREAAVEDEELLKNMMTGAD